MRDVVGAGRETHEPSLSTEDMEDMRDPPIAAGATTNACPQPAKAQTASASMPKIDRNISNYSQVRIYCSKMLFLSTPELACRYRFRSPLSPLNTYTNAIDSNHVLVRFSFVLAEQLQSKVFRRVFEIT